MKSVLTHAETLVDSLELFRASPAHTRYSVTDIYTYLQLPIQHNCIRIYYEADKPVGLITWCWLRKEDANLFLQGQYHPTQDDYSLVVEPNKDLWGMEFIAPYGHTRQMMRAIKQTTEELYGPQRVHWRRFHSRDTIRSKRFKA